MQRLMVFVIVCCTLACHERSLIELAHDADLGSCMVYRTVTYPCMYVGSPIVALIMYAQFIQKLSKGIILNSEYDWGTLRAYLQSTNVLNAAMVCRG